ncbi:MAG: hypothetical protein RLZZ118_1116, partial [Bacteroidota bacterium]
MKHLITIPFLFIIAFSFAQPAFTNATMPKDPSFCGGASPVSVTYLPNLLNQNNLLPSTIPANSVQICGGGHFRVIYMDIINNVTFGFNDNLLGVVRRNRVCDVLNYINTIVNIPTTIGGANPTIDIVFAQSINNSSNNKLASAGLVYSNIGPSGYFGGNLYNYITTGNDPSITDEDGNIEVNFAHSYNYSSSSIGDCEFDFYSVILHEMTHLLGFVSNLSYNGSALYSTLGTNQFSKFDEHFLYLKTGSTYSKVIQGNIPSINITSTDLTTDNIWLTNSITINKKNQPIYSETPFLSGTTLSHFDDHFYLRCHESPGFSPNYVMSAYAFAGAKRPNYTSQDLMVLSGIGIPLITPVTNSPPYCRVDLYDFSLGNNQNPWLEPNINNSVPASIIEFHTTTDNCSTVKVDLSTPIKQLIATNNTQDLKIFDDEGDPITVFDGKVNNIIGCGNGGNNANCISVNANNNIITFTPRPNFWGRASFGFHLSDGKERGFYIIITVDVTKGSCFTPSVTSVQNGGVNNLMNGNFEEGQQIRDLNNAGNNKYLNLAEYHDVTKYKQYASANNFIDGMQFVGNWWQDVCNRESHVPCLSSINDFNFTLIPLPPLNLPVPVGNIGNKYLHMFQSEPFNLTLAQPMQDCRIYRFKGNIMTHNNLTPPQLYFGFNSNFVYKWYNYTLCPTLNNVNSFNLQTIEDVWKDYSYDFVYHGNNTDDYLSILGYDNVQTGSTNTLSFAELYFDNLNITDITGNFTGNKTFTYCTSAPALQVGEPPVAGFTYSWVPSAGLSAVNISNPIANPTITTSYTVTSTSTTGCVFTSTVLINVINQNSLNNYTVVANPNCLYNGQIGQIQINGPSFSGLTFQLNANSPVSTNSFNVVQQGNVFTLTIAAGGCTAIQYFGVPQCPSLCNNLPSQFPSSITNVLHVPPNSNSSFFGGSISLPNNTALVFEGNFTLDANLTIINNNYIYFAPNAKMTLTNGAILEVGDSKLQSCATSLWDGIYATDLASTGQEFINIYNSKISHMENGIHIQTNKRLTLNNDILENNYKNVTLLNSNQNNIQITANKFQGTGQLLFPKNTYNSTFKSKPMFGILVKYPHNIFVGGTNVNSEASGNTFDNLKSGIVMNNTLKTEYIGSMLNYLTTNFILNCYNNVFKNITEGLNITSPTSSDGAWSIYNLPDGTAIHGQSKTCMTMLNVSAKNLPTLIHFQNCNKAIITCNVTNSINNNKLNNACNAGFIFYDLEAQKHTVVNNVMDGIIIGLMKYGNAGVGNVLNIDNNNITLKSPGNNFTNIGIGTTYYYNNNSGSINNITNNTINIPMDKYAIGGYFSNTANVSFINNKVYFLGSPSAPPPFWLAVQGLQLRACNISTINNNLFEVDGANTNSLNNSRIAGIYLYRTNSYKMYCNHVKNTQFGVISLGANLSGGTQNINGNLLETTTSGLLLRHLANEGAVGDIGLDQFTPSLKIDANNHFTDVFASNARVKRITVNCATVPNDKIVTQAINIDKNSTTQNIVFPASAIACKMAIINYAANQFDVITSCNPPPPIPPTTNPPIPFYDINNAIQIAQNSVSYSEYPNGGRWLDRVLLQEILSRDSTLVTTSPILDSFYMQEQQGTIEDLHNIDLLIASLADSAVIADSVQWNAIYEDAIAQNANINNNELVFETNERWVNATYLQILKNGVENLEAEKREQLSTLAAQCPYLAGEAVYKARAILQPFEPLKVYDDLDICNNAGVYKTTNDYQLENEALFTTNLDTNITKLVNSNE